MKLKLFTLLLAIGAVSAGHLYENYKAYDFVATHEIMDELSEWQNHENIDFWKFGAPGVESRVMVPPNLIEAFESFLTNAKIDFKVRSENVGEIEDQFEKDRIDRVQRAEARKQTFQVRPEFNIYWTSEEIDRYCQYLADTYPSFVTRESLVRSFEGADVFALKISSGGFGGKPIIFIDAGMHAREWVSQATITYFLFRLIEDASVRSELLDGVDWIIIPNLNPDGYTWSYNSDRMWRKNRFVPRANCVGVDLNRNFGFSWRQSTGVLGCNSQVYSGDGPLSEVESRALNNYMTRYRSNVKMYMSVHSFGDMMLWPWGFQGSPGRINNWERHQEVGDLWANAIREATGKNIRVGNIAEVLGNAFGASDDHMAGDQLIQLVYTAELTGGGSTGFDFPESQIEGLNHETFWGYRAYGLYIKNRYG